MNIQELKEKLARYSIDIKQFGKGKAKRPEDLLQEINDEEARLVENEELRRLISVSTINVYYQDEEGNLYLLKEEKQTFNDGRVKQRPYLKSSVQEKIIGDESPGDSARRGLREELGIMGDVKIEWAKTEKGARTSKAYPGLKTEYVLHRFIAWFSPEQYNPNGYIETQPTKSIYFRWARV